MSRSVPGRNPRVHAIWDVIIGAGASIWPGAIVRGDLVEAGGLVMGVPAKPVRTRWAPKTWKTSCGTRATTSI